MLPDSLPVAARIFFAGGYVRKVVTWSGAGQ